MPLYCYACQFCEHSFEISHGMKQKPLRKCPECGKLRLARIIQVPLLGRVSRRADEMKTVEDLAKYNTDKLTKTEKEAKDHEYTEGSRLAKSKLEKQKMARPSHHQSWEPKDMNRRLAKATDKQKKKYLKDGEIPPA